MLSRRAIENNLWFLEQFRRPLARQGSKNASTIDMATAENWLIRPEMLSLLKQNLNKNLQEEHLSYANGLGGTTELLDGISLFFNSFFSPRILVRPEHIVTGAGCSAVLDTLINDICDEGEGLLVTAPMWGSFQVSAVLRNSVQLIPVYVPFDQFHSAEAIVEAYRTAAEHASCNVRGILFCNPHNPYGHICPAEAIDRLVQYAQEANMHFVSDEIYALSTFGDLGELSGRCKEVFDSPTTQFVSVLSRDLDALGVDRSRIHVLYSISKDFGCSGIRLVCESWLQPATTPFDPLLTKTFKGCLITQANKELRMSQAILNNAKICNAATVMITPILANVPALTNLLDLNTKRLRRAARIVIKFAEFHGLTYYKPVAGLYIWIRLSVDCSNFDEEEVLVQKCSRLGIFVGSGADYSEPQPGWFRLTFAIPEDKLFDGLHRIEEAMGYKERFANRLKVDSLAMTLAKWWKGICL